MDGSTHERSHKTVSDFLWGWRRGPFKPSVWCTSDATFVIDANDGLVPYVTSSHFNCQTTGIPWPARAN